MAVQRGVLHFALWGCNLTTHWCTKRQCTAAASTATHTGKPSRRARARGASRGDQRLRAPGRWGAASCVCVLSAGCVCALARCAQLWSWHWRARGGVHGPHTPPLAQPKPHPRAGSCSCTMAGSTEVETSTPRTPPVPNGDLVADGAVETGVRIWSGARTRAVHTSRCTAAPPRARAICAHRTASPQARTRMAPAHTTNQCMQHQWPHCCTALPACILVMSPLAPPPSSA